MRTAPYLDTKIFQADSEGKKLAQTIPPASHRTIRRQQEMAEECNKKVRTYKTIMVSHETRMIA